VIQQLRSGEEQQTNVALRIAWKNLLARNGTDCGLHKKTPGREGRRLMRQLERGRSAERLGSESNASTSFRETKGEPPCAGRAPSTIGGAQADPDHGDRLLAWRSPRAGDQGRSQLREKVLLAVRIAASAFARRGCSGHFVKEEAR
jgi:hypothetical protein